MARGVRLTDETARRMVDAAHVALAQATLDNADLRAWAIATWRWIGALAAGMTLEQLSSTEGIRGILESCPLPIDVLRTEPPTT